MMHLVELFQLAVLTTVVFCLSLFKLQFLDVDWFQKVNLPGLRHSLKTTRYMPTARRIVVDTTDREPHKARLSIRTTLYHVIIM